MGYKYRDAKTGKYVSKDFAQANPDTTVRERTGIVHKIKKLFQRS